MRKWFNPVIPSNLCYTAVDEQIDTCDITAVIGCKEGDGFCDFVWVAYPSKWYSAYKVLQAKCMCVRRQALVHFGIFLCYIIALTANLSVLPMAA